MKWGVRRTPEELGHRISKRINQHQKKEVEFRKKLTKISKNRSISGSEDERRFTYRNQKLPKRVAKTASAVASHMLVADMVSGNIHNYSKMNKTELHKAMRKNASIFAGATIANVAIKDYTAKSASKRYTDQGKKIKRASKLFDKEDIIEIGVHWAVNMAATLGVAMKIQYQRAQADRFKNEAMFKRWGENILSERVDDVIWQSDDLSYAVIDKR